MFNKSKNSFFIQELHVFNLPIAIFLKLFGNVFVYTYKGKCSYFLNNSFFPSVNDYTNIDQWLYQKEKILNEIKKNLNLLTKETIKLKINEDNINLDNLYIQNFSIEYEQYFLFLFLANKHKGNKFYFNTAFRSYLIKKYPDMQITIPDITILPVSMFDKTYQAFNLIIDMMKIMFRLFFSSLVKKDINKYKYICTAISPSEIPESVNDLDFTWLVSNNLIKSDEILYILQSSPNEKATLYLKERNINHTTYNNLHRSLALKIRISLSLKLSKFLLIKLLQTNFKNNFIFRGYKDNLIWNEFFLHHSPKYFISSFSAGWPENFEILICNKLKIKSILWLYSAGEFLYTTNQPIFSDQSIRFSINEFSEIWVWNNLVKELFESRSLLKNNLSNIKVIGPTLNGNWSELKTKRKETNAVFTVTVFDLTPMKSRLRLNYGEGPFCNTELQEQFYRGIIKLHKNFPEIKIIIKTKRGFNSSLYDFVPALDEILNLKNKNIQINSNRSNPYSLIANSDLVISVPFTSPTMLALSLGVTAVYFDPIQIANYTFKNAFKDITIKTEEELFSLVRNRHMEIRRSPFDAISIDDMENRIRLSLQ